MITVRRALGHVLDFCYPGNCANCDGPTGAAEGGGASPVCGDCAIKLRIMEHGPACELCAMPIAADNAPCAYCVGKGVPHYEKILRLGIFDDPLKHLIHQMKYHRRWPLAEFLADRFRDTERAKGLLTHTQVLVPVPLHFRRHVRRGFNQAEVIARRIGAKNRIDVVHAARRTRDTETQTHLHSYEKRLENVRGAFSLRRAAKYLRGKHVVVIDDVMTTGATLQTVARVLKQAEPASLSAMVLAIADPRRRGFEVI